jgi:hypothetical protein
MAQTICNSPKTEYSPPFKMISNSNGFQFCPNHFLVGPNIALQYLGHLSYFSKMLKWPIYFCNGKEKRKGKGLKEKGQSQTGPSAQCTGPAQQAHLISLSLAVVPLLVERARVGAAPTRRRPPTEQGRGRIRAAPVPSPWPPRSLHPSLARSSPLPRARSTGAERIRRRELVVAAATVDFERSQDVHELRRLRLLRIRPRVEVGRPCSCRYDVVFLLGLRRGSVVSGRLTPAPSRRTAATTRCEPHLSPPLFLLLASSP